MNTNNKTNSRSGGGTTGRRSRSRSNSNNASTGTATTTTAAAAAAMERKEIERNRRLHMKSLCLKLASLIPKEEHCSSKDAMTQLGCLDDAAAYIRKLKARVDELQRAQLSLSNKRGEDYDGAVRTTTSSSGTATGLSSSEAAAGVAAEPAAVVEVRHSHDGSSLEVVLISSVRRPFKLHQVATVLEEEGAEIISANVSVDGRRMFHTIHSRAFSSRIGIDVSRVSERLRALV
ncbi:transcription factor bHLH168 isoform X1 [Sorghum bicolor]|uniref:BHLH domain-containing protein n=1 Tax=Sorghum bicolor TaxID=4558 RepID=A0A1B6QMU3_SORBI|nr:transcription factor bHLH168 isoform X1 [Sorghum bicolor]KXG39225.1 hypothetical protein SORBI_3001G350300 [Sorghum bicolor]|eukprot:XP_002465183.2 transcription factor bHLH168 isoform X1 [Sorghum bicolor]